MSTTNQVPSVSAAEFLAQLQAQAAEADTTQYISASYSEEPPKRAFGSVIGNAVGYIFAAIFTAGMIALMLGAPAFIVYKWAFPNEIDLARKDASRAFQEWTSYGENAREVQHKRRQVAVLQEYERTGDPAVLVRDLERRSDPETVIREITEPIDRTEKLLEEKWERAEDAIDDLVRSYDDPEQEAK